MYSLLRFAGLFLFLYALCQSGMAQTTFSISLSGNYPLTGTLTSEPASNPLPNPDTGFGIITTTDPGLEERYEAQPGFDLHLGVDRKLTEKWSVSSGLSIAHYRYQRAVSVQEETADQPIIVVTPGVPIGDPTFPVLTPGSLNTPDDVGNTNLWYLSIPLQVNFQPWAAPLRLGIGTSHALLIRSNQRIALYSNSPTPSIQTTTDTSGDDFSNYQLHALATIDYELLPKLRLGLQYQQALSTIYVDAAQAAGKARLHALRFVVSYSL